MSVSVLLLACFFAGFFTSVKSPDLGSPSWQLLLVCASNCLFPSSLSFLSSFSFSQRFNAHLQSPISNPNIQFPPSLSL